MVYTSSKAMEMNLSPFKRRRGVNELVERLPRFVEELDNLTYALLLLDLSELL
jgi:hypothetical protein